MPPLSEDPPLPLAERCAREVEAAILAGQLSPGERLDEVGLGERLGVSRNTLREAFRLLAHEQLVVHRPNRGVFVVRVDSARASQLYAVRRHLELGALDELQVTRLAGKTVPPAAMAALTAAVERGEQSRSQDDWHEVGTANARFHLALVQLAENQVAERLMRPLVSLTRLRFLELGNPRGVHEGFLDENRRIHDLLQAGQVGRARAVLEAYLLRAERDLA